MFLPHMRKSGSSLLRNDQCLYRMCVYSVFEYLNFMKERRDCARKCRQVKLNIFEGLIEI